MSKKTKVAGMPALDPTLPKVSLELRGETWRLCYDYAALAIAERKLAESGQAVNMLTAMDLRALGAARLPLVFFAGLVREHPEITPEEAAALIDMETFPGIYNAVVEAYVASCPSLRTKKDADPTPEPAG